ncbi:tat pathway signal sequence [Lasiosphaeria ovina]|uniref:Tat pathway signal sequence n=1 Tax=Lasiosphaeria ovina TaxID=92902 RepID=A0AAE0K8V4_9PEZI|nr:tat pathway signal sequence [Lasiosphaeria ovina]
MSSHSSRGSCGEVKDGELGGKLVAAWGYEFEWTRQHTTPEQMRPLLFSYDVLATECLDRLDELAPVSLPSKAGEGRTTQGGKAATVDGEPTSDGKEDPGERGGHHHHHRDLFELLRQHAHRDETLQRLWTEVNTVPEWVDWQQIKRGQHVFYRYVGPFLVGLTFQSLLGGMAFHRVVETLARTGGFGMGAARRRLLETFQHVLDVTEGLEAVQPGREQGGKGWASTVRVRLLHASVRRRILRLAASDPEYFDVARYGVPVNDLDSIGTVLAFSASLIWVSFPRQGIFLRESEIADYIALWRWVAYLLGTPTDALATPAAARTMMESLLAWTDEFVPSAASQDLANNIIASLAGQPPTYPSADFLRAEAYWLNGHALAAALAVPRPPRYYTVLVAGQCLFFMAMSYAKRAVPAWERRSIRRLRPMLRAVVLEQAGGRDATHAFKYIPNPGKFTRVAAGQRPTEGDGSGSGAETKRGEQEQYVTTTARGQWLRSSSSSSPVERRALQALLVASALAAWAAWLCAKSASSLFQTATLG